MYKIYISNLVNGVVRIADNAFIPFDPANTDYVEYLKWVSEGNQPLPADDPSAVPQPQIFLQPPQE